MSDTNNGDPVGPGSPPPPIGSYEYLSPADDPTTFGTPPVPPRTPRRTSWIAATVAMALLVGGGVAVARALAGDGAQPDDVLPSDVVAAVRLDTDPPAGQKLAVAQLANRFKDSGVTDDEDPIGQLLEKFLGNVSGKSYATDIKPWVDKRAAVALRLDPSNPENLAKAYPLLVVAYRDEEALRSRIDKLIRSGSGRPAGFVIADGFVTFSDTTAHAQASVLASRTAPLSQSPAYKSAFDKVGADSVVFGWVALGRIYEKVSKQFAALSALTGRSSSPLSALGSTKVDPDASVSFALRAGSNYAEMQIDAYRLDSSSVLSASSLGERFTQLPADSAVAVGLAGIDRGVSRALDQADELLAASGTFRNQPGGATERVPSSLDDLLDKAGLTRSSITTIVGTEVVGALDGSLGGALSVTTSDAEGAVSAITKVLRAIGAQSKGSFDAESVLDQLHLTTTPTGYAVGTAPGAVAKVAAGAPPYLGDDAVFATALPNAANSTFALYANLDKMDESLRAKLTGGSTDSPLQQVKAVGIGASHKDDTTEIRIRVVIR